MDAEKLKAFVAEIGNLNASFLGNRSFSPGSEGARTTQGDMLYTLKKNTAAFAEECSKSAPKKTKIEEMAAQVEGGLQGLNAVGVIGDPELDRLIDQLHDLKS
jgi:hypothetical protein